MVRTLLKGKAAKLFYKSACKKYDNKFPKSFVHIGGYFKTEYKGIYEAFDFCTGSEVFTEPFDNKKEAKKYASGIMAKTMDGLII